MHHSKKEQLVALWRSCFGDSEPFIRLFFERLYREEWTLTVEEKGEILSVIYLIPYQMSWEGQEIKVAYVCGVGTLPSRRGEGLMGRLMHDAMERMRQRQVDLAVLIPANERLFDLYRQYGFTEAFDYSLTRVTNTRSLPSDCYPLHRIDQTMLASWYPFFDRMIRRHPCCLLHSPADFENNLIDTRLDGGQLYGITNRRGEPEALAFVVGNEEVLYCKELLYDNEEAKEALLSHLFLQSGALHIDYKNPPSGAEEGVRYGMAMALNRRALAARWLDRHAESELSEADLLTMESAPFTALMLGYPRREAYMSLMLDS